MRIKINSKTWMSKRSKKYSPRRQTSRIEPVEGVKQFTPKVCVFSRILCCVVRRSTHNILHQPDFGKQDRIAIWSPLQSTENWTILMVNLRVRVAYPTSDVLMSPRSSSKLQRTASQSCPCTTTWIGQQRTPRLFARKTYQKSLTTQRSFLTVNWTFFGPGSDDKWYGTLTYKLNREWNRTANNFGLRKKCAHGAPRNQSLVQRVIEE